MKKLTRILAAVLMALGALSLSACGSTVKNERLLNNTQVMVEAVINDDYRAARSVLADTIPDRDMKTIFPELCEYMDDATEYTLFQTGWRTNAKGSVSMYTATFYVSTDVGDFVINSIEIDGVEGLSSFDITRAEDSLTTPAGIIKAYTGSSPWQYVFLAIMLIELAFIIWMLADCSRRAVRVKAVWIILIAAGMFTLAFNWRDSLSISFYIGSVFYPTAVMITQGVTRFFVLVPVGAVLYFILRKKLTKREPADVQFTPSPQSDMSMYGEQTNFTKDNQ